MRFIVPAIAIISYVAAQVDLNLGPCTALGGIVPHHHNYFEGISLSYLLDTCSRSSQCCRGYCVPEKAEPPNDNYVYAKSNTCATDNDIICAPEGGRLPQFWLRILIAANRR